MMILINEHFYFKYLDPQRRGDQGILVALSIEPMTVHSKSNGKILLQVGYI